jgi:hypothetical protein
VPVWRWRDAGWDVPAPERRHRGSRFALLGGVAVVALGLTLIACGGAPSQAGAQVSPVAVPNEAAAQGPTPVAAAGSTRASARCADAPGVPVRISATGARAQNTPIEAHGLDRDGTLYVPQDPAIASWLDYPAVGPGADHGSAVLTTHVNYAHVLGAFGDLTAYRAGQHIGVTLADGRLLSYHVVPAASMGFDTTATALVLSKAELDHDPSLRARVFDFTGAWAETGGPRCGRLVLVTCTGRVVDHNYLDNAFVFALPDR